LLGWTDMVALSLLPCLALLAAPPAAPPAASASTPFMSWFHARAKHEGAYLITHFQLDLDGDEQDDDVVCYDFKQGVGTTLPVVLVGLASGERFALSGGGIGPGLMDRCPRPTRGGHPEVLTLGRSGTTGWSDTVSVRFDRHGPLLVATSSGDRYHSASLSLLAQRFSRLSREDSESEEEDGSEERHRSEGAVVLAPGTESPAGHPPVWVSWGRKHWSGKEDADLRRRRIQARPRGSPSPSSSPTATGKDRRRSCPPATGSPGPMTTDCWPSLRRGDRSPHSGGESSTGSASASAPRFGASSDRCHHLRDAARPPTRGG